MKSRLFILSLTVLATLSSCNDMLDTKLTNEWSEKDAYANSTMTQGILLDVYANVMEAPDTWDNNFSDAATDNALTRNVESSAYIIGQGGVTSAVNPVGIWNDTYSQIQMIHKFLAVGLNDNVRYSLSDDASDAAIKQRLEGEAYFLRAWCEFKLLRMYGGKTADGQVLGFPIITEYTTLEEASKLDGFKRNTYEECVEQICRDCEKAIELLPMVYTDGNAVVGATEAGRASGLAAHALKSRVLLYAASPAFQSNDVVRHNAMGDYTIVNEAAYKAKWERAALYANEVLQLPEMGGYAALVPNDLCSGGDNQSAELLFRTYMGNVHELESRHYPPFYYGTANTVPSENLAEAFPANNGFPITDARSGYDSSNPYACKRDKRFSANVYYHGCKFGTNGSAIDVAEGGKDSQFFSSNATKTGYYLAKFINTGLADMLKPLYEQNSRHYNPLLRKAEVWYNFAEAANEAWGPNASGPGCNTTAYEVIKTVREVSGGITDVTYLDEQAADKDKFRVLIQNERRIEFSFENHRYWDVRRWLLPLNETIKGMVVTRDNDQLEYTVKEIEKRPLNDVKFYYMPLPYADMQKCGNLVNNIGW